MLVVDDEPTVRRVIARVLTRAGFRVEACADGAEAVDALGRERPDLVLLDLNMPGVDGWDVLEEVDAQERPPPVLVCTACTDGDKARRYGCVADLLIKPIPPDELLSAVRAALGEAPGS